MTILKAITFLSMGLVTLKRDFFGSSLLIFLSMGFGIATLIVGHMCNKNHAIVFLI
jgi:hypothetical protein